VLEDGGAEGVPPENFEDEFELVSLKTLDRMIDQLNQAVL